ncbi:putative uncharacterized protein [Mycoplasma sp. CAG:877]|nr:putative uncharacterized protein [Mycoplasma sp. CAG:877]
MNDKYMEVPNDILTGKDLDYLCDMFQWNYGALKSSNDSVSSINDKEIIDIMQRAGELFDDNLNVVLDILGGVSYE